MSILKLLFVINIVFVILLNTLRTGGGSVLTLVLMKYISWV